MAVQPGGDQRAALQLLAQRMQQDNIPGLGNTGATQNTADWKKIIAKLLKQRQKNMDSRTMLTWLHHMPSAGWNRSSASGGDLPAQGPPGGQVGGVNTSTGIVSRPPYVGRTPF